MTDCADIATYRIAFELTNCRAVHSDAIPKAASIAMPLPSQITSSKVIAVQLEGYSADGNLVAKSEKMVKIKFHPSVCGVETGADNEPFGMAAEVNANTQARHKHANASVLNSLSDKNGVLLYNGESIRITADSELSDDSENPVQNKVIKAAFDAVGKTARETSDKVTANEIKINNQSKETEAIKSNMPENPELLNRFSDNGILLYNGSPVGEKPTASVELSVNNDGLTIEVDSEKNCIFGQFQGMENGIPVGTRIATIEFFVNDKWVDIRQMAELDFKPCILNYHKVFAADDIGANAFALWNPSNTVSSGILNYSIDRVRLTYVLPKISFYVDGSLYHVEYAELNGSIQLPEEPEKDYYSLIGWIPEGSTEIADFPLTVSGNDIYLYAEWVQNEIILGFRKAFSSSDFDYLHETVYKCGEPLVPPEFEVEEGHVFLGWVDGFEIMPDNLVMSFPKSLYEEYRMPSVVPDSVEYNYYEYYPLYFEGGYIEAEEGYNDTANVWFKYPYQSRNIYCVGGVGSLNRSTVDNMPWYEVTDGQLVLTYYMIIGHGITEISNFGPGTQCLWLPSTLTKIHAGTFNNSDYTPRTIYYEGTEEQWAAIEIGENNDGLAESTIEFNQPKIII